MGQAMGQACSAAFAPLVPKVPTSEQKERVDEISRSLIARNTANAVVPKLSKAKKLNYQPDGAYGGAAVPSPTIWRRAQLLMNSCCEDSTGAQLANEPEIRTLQDSPEQPVAPIQATRRAAYLEDPGPPQPVAPAPFLGPRVDIAKAHAEALGDNGPAPGYGGGYGYGPAADAYGGRGPVNGSGYGPPAAAGYGGSPVGGYGGSPAGAQPAGGDGGSGAAAAASGSGGLAGGYVGAGATRPRTGYPNDGPAAGDAQGPQTTAEDDFGFIDIGDTSPDQPPGAGVVAPGAADGGYPGRPASYGSGYSPVPGGAPDPSSAYATTRAGYGAGYTPDRGGAPGPPGAPTPLAPYGVSAPRPEESLDCDTMLARAAAQAKFFRDRYTLGKRLSAGAQGVTYLAKANYSGVDVVVKKPNNPQDINDYLQLSTKTHPNIVRVYELFQEEVETFIVMEYCDGGDLFHAIEDLKAPTQNWTSNVFRQVLWGVKYLHDFFNESHNDIKPENIFLDRKPTGPNDVPRAMIGDFGCLAKIDQATTGGDPRYRAPETFDVPVWGAATDMWSLGVTLYEIASGGLTIYTNEKNLSSWEKFRNSEKWEPLRIALLRAMPVPLGRLGSDDVPEIRQLKALLQGLLQTHPGRRLTADRALEQPWLKLNPADAPVSFDEDCSKMLAKRARRHCLDVALLNLIGNLLQGESIRHYQEIWERYDRNSDGSMSRAEFNAMIADIAASHARLATMQSNAALGAAASRSFSGPPGVNPSAQDLFTLADKNNSGRIEFNEFVGIMFSPEELPAEEYGEYLKAAFLSLAHHDGRIGPEDFAGLFANGWAQTRAATEVTTKLFHDMDTDEDGYVSFQEFSAYMEGL